MTILTARKHQTIYHGGINLINRERKGVVKVNNLYYNNFSTRKTFFITKEGLDILKQRLDSLLQKRLEISTYLRSLDVDEKSDTYVSHNELNNLELAEIESTRIANILQRARAVIKRDHPTAVEIGSTVKLRSNSQDMEYTIVSALEADPSQRMISEVSPLGRALMGKRADETVSITAPSKKEYEYRILSIE